MRAGLLKYLKLDVPGFHQCFDCNVFNRVAVMAWILQRSSFTSGAKLFLETSKMSDCPIIVVFDNK